MGLKTCSSCGRPFSKRLIRYTPVKCVVCKEWTCPNCMIANYCPKHFNELSQHQKTQVQKISNIFGYLYLIMMLTAAILYFTLFNESEDLATIIIFLIVLVLAFFSLQYLRGSMLSHLSRARDTHKE